MAILLGGRNALNARKPTTFGVWPSKRIWGTVRSARRLDTGIVALEVAEVSDTY